MQEKLKQYIIDNLEKEPKTKRFFDNFFKKNILFETDDEESNLYSADASYEETPLYHRKVYGLEKRKDIKNYIEENEDKSSFQNLLFKYIDERNLKDSDVYNKVHIDRRLFSKIRSNDNYHPSKETIILLGLSLQLSEEEIELLLESASYSLPKNNYYDLIIRFCFKEKIYQLTKVNDLLEIYGCKQFSY